MIHVEHLSHLGEALKELRWQARMKQVEVCRKTGMTAPQVSRYENGRETPTLEPLVRYLSAVGADFCDFQRALVAVREQAREGAEEGVPEAAPEVEPEAAPAAAPQLGPSLEEIRDEGDRRLAESPGLRHVVGGLVELNIEGLERLERRLRSLEQRLARGGL